MCDWYVPSARLAPLHLPITGEGRGRRGLTPMTIVDGHGDRIESRQRIEMRTGLRCLHRPELATQNGRLTLTAVKQGEGQVKVDGRACAVTLLSHEACICPAAIEGGASHRSSRAAEGSGTSETAVPHKIFYNL